MWGHLANFVLKYRLALLVSVVGFSAWMGYVGLTRAEFTQEFSEIIPAEDPDMAAYVQFREQFGADGGTLLVGMEGENAWNFRTLNELRALAGRLRQDTGIVSVSGVVTAQRLEIDTAQQRFVLRPAMPYALQNQAQADSLRAWFLGQPFYRGLLYSPDGVVSVFGITYSQATMASKRKHKLIREVEQELTQLANDRNFTIRFSGLPFVRTYVSRTLPAELGWFSLAALLFTALALYLFYRSLYSVVFPLILLVMASLCTIGVVGLFGYKISILMAMLPPVIIILGIPPSIYMLSDYHEEYVKTGNKFTALRLMVRKLGLVTLMINANTALGFLTLCFTEVRVLEEFGLVAFIGTMLTYFLTIILIPGVYSLLPAPGPKMVKHLEAPRINRFLGTVDGVVHRRRGWVYAFTVVAFGVGLGGAVLLQPVSHIIDDLPRSANVYTDFLAMEARFGGVMPFEVVVEVPENQAVTKHKWLKRVANFQERLRSYPEVARTTSAADVVMWARQALANGDSAAYQLPIREEFDLVQLYANNTQNAARRDTAAGPGLNGMLAALSDSTGRKIRITGFVRDVGSLEMPHLMARIQRDLDSAMGITRVSPILAYQDSLPASTNANGPSTILTGTTRIFLKANDYLLDNLFWSLIAVFAIIGLQMLLLFSSWRIMLISMIPNLVPLVLTAGIMGYFGIPLKPSTALIFEMAFGIAIDNSIHYLAMYRHYRRTGLDVNAAVTAALRHTGMGIVYTSVVLFMGFIIFVPSAFGSTSSLGILTSITLFVATFSNLFLMPALLISFDKHGKLTGHAMIDDTDDAEPVAPTGNELAPPTHGPTPPVAGSTGV